MWEQLNRIMQERNLNGHQLSKMAGVNRSFFSDLKSGKVKYLSWPNICKVADALGISIDELDKTKKHLTAIRRILKYST